MNFKKKGENRQNTCGTSVKKKWILYVAAVFLAAGITGTAAYAYLIDYKEALNQIEIAENKTHIGEEFEPPDDPYPGQVIKKKPRILNDSEIPVYVRARILFSDSRAMEQCEPLCINASWKPGKDGYYYYSKTVLPGTSTDTVFDNIVIKKTVKKQELVPFDIFVYEEAVQADGFPSAEEAFAGM